MDFGTFQQLDMAGVIIAILAGFVGYLYMEGRRHERRLRCLEAIVARAVTANQMQDSSKLGPPPDRQRLEYL